MEQKNLKTALLARFTNGSAQVGIIGLGYVGLPLATVFAEAGLRVLGFDIDRHKVEAINRGESYVEDVPSALLRGLVAQGRLAATDDFNGLEQCDAVCICVPTPLHKTRDPDVSYIISATEQVARCLRPGQVIVLESTTYPGTTREVVLEKLKETGLRVGTDYFLAFSPERVDPGRSDWTTKTTPKVMGGITADCLEVASALYQAAIDTLVPVSSPEAAEMAKILENTFRAVNIGLVNEVLLICDRLGLDAWEVINAAATKPFGFMKFTPGPGLGGHCIPIDPLYLSWKLKSMNYTARFIELASEVNTSMPHYWVRRVQDALNAIGKAVRGHTILLLGIAYKKDVSDLRESPALDILMLLHSMGARVLYHDPHVAAFQHDGLKMTSIVDLEGGLAEADCALIVTDHSVYNWESIQQHANLLVDTRGVLANRRMKHRATYLAPAAQEILRTHSRNNEYLPLASPEENELPLLDLSVPLQAVEVGTAGKTLRQENNLMPPRL